MVTQVQTPHLGDSRVSPGALPRTTWGEIQNGM